MSEIEFEDMGGYYANKDFRERADQAKLKSTKTTYADKIRAMSDEELAMWLVYNAFKNIDAFLNDLREQANISVSYPKDEKRLFENTVKRLKEEVQDGIL